jgi:predicted GNAT family acetyltransferase
MQDGHVAGYLEYHRRGNVASFLHTIVDPASEGQGIGSTIVKYALDEARRLGWLVLPYCPFVSAYIAKHPEYLDLVPADRRAEFPLGQLTHTTA